MFEYRKIPQKLGVIDTESLKDSNRQMSPQSVTILFEAVIENMIDNELDRQQKLYLNSDYYQRNQEPQTVDAAAQTDDAPLEQCHLQTINKNDHFDNGKNKHWHIERKAEHITDDLILYQ